MRETPFTYPVIAIHGVDHVKCAFNERRMLNVMPYEVAIGHLDGMLVFDALGRCWRMRLLGHRSASKYFLARITKWGERRRLSIELEERPETFDDLKEGLCAFIDFNEETYDIGEDGFLTGVFGERLKEKVRRTRSIKGLINLLMLHSHGAPIRRRK